MRLDGCAQCEPRRAHADTHAGVERAEWFPLNAINPLDGFNKGLRIVFYLQEKNNNQSTLHMQLLRLNP